MDFVDKLQELAGLIPQQMEHIHTEEATKSALVMPFINALGYNVFDPREVTPEFVADVGVKKGEKVDYVILKDGKPIMMFECKSISTDLEKVTPSQLYRYFSVSAARIGILTNGIVYRFFSDLEEPNKMDSKPFLELNMLGMEEPVVEEIKKFTKSAFDVETVLLSANEFKYTREFKRILAIQLQEPSDEFIKLFASHFYSGRMSQSTREQFSQCLKRAFNQFINEHINARLKSALVADTSTSAERVESPATPAGSAADMALPPLTTTPPDRQITTTAEELEAYYIIKAILRDALDVKRIVMRDALSYCAILLDDNNRKPICRLYFSGVKKFVDFIDEQKHEEKIGISTLDDLYKLADRFTAATAMYSKQQP